MARSALGPAPAPRYTTEVVRPVDRPAQAADRQVTTADFSAAMLDAIDAFGAPAQDSSAVLPTQLPVHSAAITPTPQPEITMRQVTDKLNLALTHVQHQYMAAFAAQAALRPRVTQLQQQIELLRADSGSTLVTAGVVPRIRKLAKGIQDLRNDAQHQEQHYLARISMAAQDALRQQIRTTAHCSWRTGTIPVHAFVRTALFDLNRPTSHTDLTALYRDLALPDQARVVAALLRASMEARQAGVRLADIQHQLRLLLTDQHNRLGLDAVQREYLLEATQYDKQRQVEGLFRHAREITRIAEPEHIPDLPALVQAIQDEQATTIRTFCDRYTCEQLADRLADAGRQIEPAVRVLHYEYAAEPQIKALMQAIRQRWNAGTLAYPACLPREIVALRALLIDSRHSLVALAQAYADDPETIPILLIYLAHGRAS